jgi:hypothetical protein
MTTPGAHVVWSGTDDSGRYRIVDRGQGQSPRFVLEQEMQPDSLGGIGWSRVGLPLESVLTQALAALLDR